MLSSSSNTTSPCTRLNEDVLQEIFIHCVLFHYLSIGSSIRDSPQLSVSHVCSSWRHVALLTPQLWNNVELQGKPNIANLDIAREYLSRARNLPVSIKLDGLEADEQEISTQLTNFLSSYRLRALIIRPNAPSFCYDLHDLPQWSVADLKTLEIFNRFSDEKQSIDLSDTRYPSLTFAAIYGAFKISGFSTSLRIFEGRCISMTITEAWDLLNQCPSLEDISFCIPWDGYTNPEPVSVPRITLQHLRSLFLYSESFSEVNEILFTEALTLPAIKELSLQEFQLSSGFLTAFKSLARRSNHFPHLICLDLALPNFSIYVYAFLATMPSLKRIYLSYNDSASFDDVTLTGLASGTLAPHLQFLSVKYVSNEEEFLDMVELRMKNAQASCDCIPAPFREVRFKTHNRSVGSKHLLDMKERGIPIDSD